MSPPWSSSYAAYYQLQRKPRVAKQHGSRCAHTSWNLPSDTNTVQPFRLLDLPGELRNQIYHLLLHKATRQRHGMAKYSPNTSPDLDPYKGWMQWGHNCLETAILATNHTVHDEAAAIMYGTQPFFLKIRSVSIATVWTIDRHHPKCLVAPRYIKLIKHLNIQVDLSLSDACWKSGFKANLFMLWSNIQALCLLLENNLLIRVEIDFRNLLLRQLSWPPRSPEVDVPVDGQETLDPFMLLSGVKKVVITGDVQPLYALELKAAMEGCSGREQKWLNRFMT